MKLMRIVVCLKKMVNLKLGFFIFVFTLFYLRGIISFDPDFGWRIRAGEYYWNYGIPKTDIFSYTMPNFPWVDHAWGMSLIFYLFNEFLGHSALVFFMTFLMLATILILSKSISRLSLGTSFYERIVFIFQTRLLPGLFLKFDLKNLHPFSFFPIILSTSIFLPFFGVRAQVISWFMFSVLVYWISDEEVFKKIRFFLPLFFLVWANLHGSYALGVFTLFLYLCLKFFKTRKIISSENFIGLFSFVTTFINPYGAGVWREAWSSASDPRLRWIIAEWMPALTMFDLAMAFLICLSLVLIWKYRREYTTFELILYLFLFLQAVLSKRQVPLWAIVALPLTARGIYYFWKDTVKVKRGSERFVGVYRMAWVLSLSIFLFQALLSFKGSYAVSLEKFYPVSGVVYLNQNQPRGQIFSDYNWGGYLILNLPQKKVFIDGRMPSWRWTPEGVNDLASAFDTHRGILSGKVDYEEVFLSFGVDTVLAKKGSRASGGDLYNKAKKYLNIFGWEGLDFDFIKTLEEDGWEKVYEDDTSVIYQKALQTGD
jgi:hypothetical protein